MAQCPPELSRRDGRAQRCRRSNMARPPRHPPSRPPRRPRAAHRGTHRGTHRRSNMARGAQVYYIVRVLRAPRPRHYGGECTPKLHGEAARVLVAPEACSDTKWTTESAAAQHRQFSAIVPTVCNGATPSICSGVAPSKVQSCGTISLQQCGLAALPRSSEVAQHIEITWGGSTSASCPRI
jgi:hypothetical protein